MEMTKERWLPRIFSHSASSGYEGTFRDGVRIRDGKCVLTGMVNLGAEDGCWVGFEVAGLALKLPMSFHWRGKIFGSERIMGDASVIWVIFLMLQG